MVHDDADTFDKQRFSLSSVVVVDGEIAELNIAHAVKRKRRAARWALSVGRIEGAVVGVSYDGVVALTTNS